MLAVAGRIAGLFFLFAAFLCANAQGDAKPDPALSAERPLIAPNSHSFSDFRLRTGFDASMTLTGVHDSSIGWYNVLTPTVSYIFTPRFSADAGFSVYPYRLAQNQNQNPPPGQTLIATHGSVSDLSIGFHATTYPRNFQNTTTLSMTAPTGNRADGLGVGRATFDFSNYMQRYVKRGGLLLETGVGDSAGLFNRLVPDQDTSLGPLAHFQTGFFVWGKGRSYLQTVAYEQLPIGDQKLYTTLTRPGFPNQTVVSGRKVGEDNGLTTSIGIPLSSHLTMTTVYNRSLRLHLDTFSTGITFSFRGRSTLSRIDEALREAERPD